MRQSGDLARRAVVPLCAIWALAPALWAQELTSQISGTVRDGSGRGAAGVVVTLKSGGTGIAHVARTDDAGYFVLSDLLPGTFNLTAAKGGFKTYRQTDIVLDAIQHLTLESIVLELGQIDEVITVEANAAAVQTSSAERTALVDSRQMQELSMKGRDYLGMLQLLPGVVDTNSQTRDAPGGGNALQGIYFDGNRQGSLNLTLDGITTLDTGGGTGPFFEPNMDSIAEVQVLFVGQQAEFGRSSGGTITAVTKNGTREFRGGAYYYLRNEDLNANDFFSNLAGLRRPRYRYNNPGYFVGGPVLIPGTRFNKNRDKLFFFWSDDYLTRQYPSIISYQTFPTAAERRGDFSQSVGQNGQLITVTDPLTNAPFPGNKVPASRIDGNGQGLLNLFPLPNASDPTHTFNYIAQSNIDQPRTDRVLRIDWNVSAATQFYIRGIRDYEAKEGGFGYTLSSPGWPQLPVNYGIHGDGLVMTLIHALSPRSVNQFTFGLNRGVQTEGPLNNAALVANSRADLNLSLPQFYPQSNPSNLVPNATFGGVSDAPQLNLDQRYPFTSKNNVWELSDSFSLTRGAHNMKFGIFGEYAWKNFQLASAFNGTFAFDRDSNDPLDTGYAFSNALIGTVDSYTESTAHPIAHARDKSVEWFAQDAWRVNSRFTVEAGLRMYWIDPTQEAGEQIAAFDAGTYNRALQPPLIQPYIVPGTTTRVGRDPVTGALLPAVKIGSFSTAAGTPNQGMKVYNQTIMSTPPVQFAPRLGLAWDPFGDGKTAVRSAFGIFYDRFPQNQVSGLVTSPPLVNTPTANYTTIASLLSTPLSLSPNIVSAMQTNFKPPAVYNWTLDVQRNVGLGMVLDVAYIGDVSRHNLQMRNLNATNYGTNFLPSSIDTTVSGNRALPSTFLRPIQGYSDIDLMEFASNANYNALQLHLTKRFSSRLTLSASYTWSKVLDVADTQLSFVNPVL
ncbi:MAG TPA: carboxypeptidase-like regulatory domain-containing protein, partial [Bryobacteraceae bacterium]